MRFPLPYSEVLESYGIPLNQFTPGSSEVALDKAAAFKALHALEGSEVGISGGDVVRISQGKLDYVYANWSCAKREGEGYSEFAARSRRVAWEYVEQFLPIEDYVPLFVFVVSAQSS